MALQNFHLDKMIGGWFVGNFKPSVMQTENFEVAVKRYKAGATEASHVHFKADEITVVVEGEVEMNGKKFIKGEIIHLAPGEKGEFRALTDTINVVVKSPSIIGDKHLVTPSNKLNIVIPMAGRGSRFLSKGYHLPKPLIEIHGIPMIRLVIENLKPVNGARFIFLTLKEHQEKYGIDKKLKEWAENAEVLTVDQVTEGAACTVLLARHLIDNDQPLMIANSDQWINYPIEDYLKKIAAPSNLDGLIMTMKASDPKWSYTKLNELGQVSEVVEKKVVSDEATVGIYNFKKGSDFVRAADWMIKNNIRVNGEFYVAPVYNQLIKENKNIGILNIGQVENGMYGLGTPEDLNLFNSLSLSKNTCQKILNRPPQLGVVIPLWNEEKNIDKLVEMIARSDLLNMGLKEVILVNNASIDRTGGLIEKWKEKYPWIKTLHLEKNQNYGGGIFEGMKISTAEALSFIPGDLQISASDLAKVWAAYLSKSKKQSVLFKGMRTVRKDGISTKIVSRVYTFLSNRLLNLGVNDINGLPKVFNRKLLDSLPQEKMKTFVFDAQILYTAKLNGWDIVEVPVTFHARREGVSSWSGKRIKTYIESFKQLKRLKNLTYPTTPTINSRKGKYENNLS
jgi:NDP-sugar pyrophosphorylase family protein/quercetin dioxygenase-like cupin family protein